MVKLTQEMVVARTKTSDLDSVKKFNCWGADLDDISLVRRFRNAEILSLSLNKISTLADFQFCVSLVELYIRGNNIRDLSEVCYLAELPLLRRLLLSENPCVETAGTLYRATVLRCLPNLEIFDGVSVTPEEVEMAHRDGLILEHPLNRRGSPDCIPSYAGENSRQPIVQRVVRQNLIEYAYEDDRTEYRHPQPHSQGQTVKEYRYHSGGRENPSQYHRSTNTRPIISQASLGNSSSPNLKIVSTKILRAQQQQRIENNNTNAIDSFPGPTNGVYINSRDQNYPLALRESEMNSPRRQSLEFAEQYYGELSKQRSKTSNLLSAVLSLISELDYQSLEVVQVAIRRRIERESTSD